jgi:squalene-hopene/tetraprenyl-beta-curcumene cyclase
VQYLIISGEIMTIRAKSLFCTIIVFFCFQNLVFPLDSIGEKKIAVKKIISTLTQEILSQKKISTHNGVKSEYFDYTAILGTHYTSMYFLMLKWTGDFTVHSKYEALEKEHLSLLSSMQMSNGSWYRLLDVNLAQKGDLSATVLNYFLFKSAGENINSELMNKARLFILAHGGVENVDTITKIFLANFNNFPWSKTPKIPYLIFNSFLPFNEQSFAAWIGPHIAPLAVLRNLQLSKKLGSDYNLRELRLNQDEIDNHSLRIRNADREMLEMLIQNQRPRGSWGGYFISTLFAKMVLSHFENNDFLLPSGTANTSDKATKFLDLMMFEMGESKFYGATQDGHIWDSILVTQALLEANVDHRELEGVIRHIERFQRPNGGFPFGYDFENAPDVDDTAEAIITLNKSNKINVNTLLQAKNFLLKMQNDNGGWGAFSKNNNGNFLLNFLARGLSDSADLFDEASADVTGHALEALGQLGLNVDNSKAVRNAVAFLKSEQTHDGAWLGRWGINYIYGTSASVVGLLTVGVRPDSPMITKAKNWLITKQNLDGGWGEGSASYANYTLAGIGESTPSQTAWALLALERIYEKNHFSIERGVDFLIENFKLNNTFIDQSVTATGHPNACYMQYPVYAKAFPLIALSRYLEL